jgi:RHS repeat-associated protein
MRTPVRRYYRGNNLVAMHDVQANQKRVYHFDHQGTTQCLTDATTGAVTDRFAADAWGVPVKRTGTSINRQWYAGSTGYQGSSHEVAPGVGVYVRQRWFHPLRGSWLSPDPEFPDVGFHYVSNDPINATDPTGLVRIGNSCRSHPWLPGVLSIIQCLCRRVVGDLVTIRAEKCCSYTVGSYTYSRFLDTCVDPPLPRRSSPCDCNDPVSARIDDMWCLLEERRRRHNEAIYHGLLDLCDPTKGPFLRCRNDGWCKNPSTGAFIFPKPWGDIHLCMNNLANRSTGVCEAGVIFHEMGHAVGFDLWPWNDNMPGSPVVNCFGGVPCHGVPQSKVEREEVQPGSGPCFGLGISGQDWTPLSMPPRRTGSGFHSAPA